MFPRTTKTIPDSWLPYDPTPEKLVPIAFIIDDVAIDLKQKILERAGVAIHSVPSTYKPFCVLACQVYLHGDMPMQWCDFARLAFDTKPSANTNGIFNAVRTMLDHAGSKLTIISTGTNNESRTLRLVMKQTSATPRIVGRELLV